MIDYIKKLSINRIAQNLLFLSSSENRLSLCHGRIGQIIFYYIYSRFANELEKDEQKVLCGGCIFCSCGWEYAGPQEGPDDDKYGGSSKADNDASNDNGSWW